ncbi:MAG: hypothetical protein ACYC9O_03460 [Candidatus Latescibacterota bacterium]
MLKKRNFAFVIAYSLIVASMLFMFFFVQKQHDQDPSGPFRKKFMDKFFTLSDSGSFFPDGVQRCFPADGSDWRLLFAESRGMLNRHSKVHLVSTVRTVSNNFPL